MLLQDIGTKVIVQERFLIHLRKRAEQLVKIQH